MPDDIDSLLLVVEAPQPIRLSIRQSIRRYCRCRMSPILAGGSRTKLSALNFRLSEDLG